MTASDRLYDRNFFLAFVSQTSFVAANTLMAHYSRWIEFLGGDLRRVGSVMGVGALVGLLLRPWMAQWINRLGARTMWGIGYVLFSVASVANAPLVSVGPAIYLIRSALVMGTAIVFASGLTYISQSSPEHRRTEAIGIFGIGGFLGMMIGPFMGDLFLHVRERANFEFLFLVAAILNILPALMLYFLRPTESERTDSSIRIADFFSTLWKHWPGMILLVDLAFGICMAGPFVFVASFIDRAGLHIDGVSVIGLFFLFYAGLGITVRIFSRRLPDRIGAGKVLFVGMLFQAAGMFCFGLVDREHSMWIVLPAVLAGIGHGLTFHTMTSLTLAQFPKEVRGTGSAVALMMLDLGTIAGAPILGAIGQRYGFAALFSAIGVFCLIVALAYGMSRWLHHGKPTIARSM